MMVKMEFKLEWAGPAWCLVLMLMLRNTVASTRRHGRGIIKWGAISSDLFFNPSLCRLLRGPPVSKEPQ
jgi:hypothetical protein